MTIKIDAPKGYNIFWNGGKPDGKFTHSLPGPCRIVRESDWRKIMAVVKAADIHRDIGIDALCDADDERVWDAIDALRKHLEKRSVSVFT